MQRQPHTARASLTRGWRSYVRAFWPSAGMLLLLCVLTFGVTLGAISLLPSLAQLQLPLVLNESGVGVSPTGLVVLAAEVSIPGALILALLMGAFFVAVVRVFDAARGSRPLRVGAALLFGVKGSVRAAMTIVLVAVLVGVLAVATPFIMVLGLVGLLVAAVAALLHKAPPVSWQWALAALIPFGLALVALVRFSLAVPLLALEGHDPVAALGRSWRVTKRHAWMIAAVLLLAFGAYFAVQVAFEALALTPLPALLVTLVTLTVQLLTFGFPIAVVTELARGERDREHPIVPLPEPRQPVSRWATATAVVAAMLLGVMVTVVPGTPAYAGEGDGQSQGESAGPSAETPPAETPPGETPPGETPPGETPPGETPPGEGPVDPPAGVFQPTLDAVEGVLTAPGAPVTLRILASDADGGMVPYTFFFEAFLVEANGDRTFLGGGQAAGGGREAHLPINLSNHPLAVGAHQFEVETNYMATSSAEMHAGPTLQYTHLVSAIDATTTVTLSTNTTSLVADESVQLRAVVASDSGPVVAGEVTFQRAGGNDPNAVTVPVAADGTAEASYSGFTVGSHQLEAVYRYVASGVIATSAPLTITALPYPSTLVLTPPPTASVVHQPATFAFELRTPRGGLAPQGTIELRSGANTLASVQAGSLAFDGQAVRGTFNTSALPIGANTLTASFVSSDGQHDAVTSGAVTHEVRAIPTALTLDSSNGWSVPRGASTVVRVGFDLPPGVQAHTGGTLVVTFRGAGHQDVTGLSACTVTIAETRCEQPLDDSFASTEFALGNVRDDLEIEASVTGSPTHEVTSAKATLAMRAATPQIGLTLTVPGLPGDAQHFTAVVWGETPVKPIDGSLQVRLQGTQNWLTIPVNPLAPLAFDYTLGVGEHVIEARYLSARPDEFTDASTSQSFFISTAATNLALTPPAAPPRVGENYQVFVTATSPGWPVPAGTIIAERAGATVATAPIAADGTATLTLPGKAAGSDAVLIRYAGSPTHSAASESLTVTIDRWVSQVVLDTAGIAPTVGVPGVLQATVTSDVPVNIASVVGAPVVFFIDGSEIGSAPVAADGTATLSVPGITQPGVHSIEARFSGVVGAIAASADQRDVTLAKVGTTIDLSEVRQTVSARESVQLVVRVVPDQASSVSPAGGTVTLSGAFPVHAQVATVAADGTATFTVQAPAAEGDWFGLTATYLGTSQTAASSNGMQVQVTAAPVNLSVEGAGQVIAGDHATLTVRMSTAGSIPLPAAGAIDLYAGAALIGSQAVQSGNGGAVTFDVATPSQLAIGTYQLTARLRASYGYQLTTSSSKPFEVQGRETEVLLSLAPSGSTPHGVAVTATARVDVVWSGDQPQGTVWLRNGTQVLATAPIASYQGDRGVVTFTVAGLPIGQYALSAEYLPSGGLNAPSTSAVQSHEVTGRVVTVNALIPALQVGHDASIAVTVADPNPAGGSAPGGEVDLLLGGQLVGTTRLLPNGAAQTSNATVLLPLQWLQGLEQTYTVRYRSDDAVHSYGERVLTVPVERLVPVVVIQPITDLSTLRWGDPFFVRVTANRAADPVANLLTPPTGVLGVSLADGSACTLDGAFYRCVAPNPGQVQVIAQVAADTNYVGHTETLVVGAAAKRTPDLAVTLAYPGAELETGATVRLSWALDGPGVKPTITGLAPGATCTGVASGSCEFSYPATAGGANQSITVSFAGDARWQPATWQRVVTPVGCFPLTLRSEPIESGTLAVATTNGGQCASGGYREGTRVGIRITPADTGTPTWAYQVQSVNGQSADAAVGGLFWFTVGRGAGQVTEITARFTSQTVCYPVTLQEISDGSQSLGTLTFGTLPNCPGKPMVESVSLPQIGGPRTTAVVGWFVAGTVLSPRATSFAGAELYASRRSAEATVETSATAWQAGMTGMFTVTESTRVQARFGPVCLPVTLKAEGPGSIERITGPNCRDEFRADQYQQGTAVLWQASADPTKMSYLDRVSEAEQVLPQQRTGDTRPTAAQVRVSAEPGHSAGVVRFDQCFEVTLRPLTPALGTAETFTNSNCPVGGTPPAGTARFIAGSQVQLLAYPSTTRYPAPRFSSWNFPVPRTDPAQVIQNVSQFTTFTVTSSIVLQPAFAQPGTCAPVTVRSGDANVEVRVSAASDAVKLCAPGTLLDGWTGGALSGEMSQGGLTLESRALSGNPKLGWAVTGVGAGAVPTGGVGTPGAVMTLTGGGGRTLTAYACQEVAAYVGLTDVSGEVAIAKQRDGTFIEISPAPNCPFSATAWTVGTVLSLQAGADARGYQFSGWGGVAVVDQTDPLRASYTVDVSAPTVSVTTAYTVICHTLTITGKAHRVAAMPQPNCPGAASGSLDENNVYTGQYIGGTAVALFGEVPGGNVWQGWRGDVVETGKVQPAVVIMDADKSAEHRYRGKSWDEKAEDFFTDVGNELAVAAKKALGGLSYVAGKALQEVPPFSLVGEAFDVLSVVGQVLNTLGVPASVTKYFDYPSQSLNWVMSGFTCLAAAGLSSQNGGNSANLQGVADSNQKAVYGAGGTVFRAIGLDPGDDNEAVGEALEKLYLAGKTAAYVQKYAGEGESIGKAMDMIDNGLEIYGLVTGPQGVGWDSSAADAWDADMGKHLTGCMAAATPDFIRGALPISNKDFVRYENDYGL